MMTVVNKRTHKPTSNDVYIGRGSIWGNPYVIGKDGDRETVIYKYEELMVDRLGFGSDEMVSEMWKDKLRSLEGKTLVCYCAPLGCHGDVLEQLRQELDE